MPSVTDSGIFGSWQTGSVIPDPLLSIQEQSPAALLPPTTLSCLFTHQPPVVSVRVYVYHNYRALQPPPRRPCSPAPPRCPACSQSWHGTISYLPPSCLLGLRGTGSLTPLLPLPSLQPSLPLLSHELSLWSLHCHLPPCSFACCWPHHVRSILPLLSLCVIISHGRPDCLTSHFCWS